MPNRNIGMSLTSESLCGREKVPTRNTCLELLCEKERNSVRNITPFAVFVFVLWLSTASFNFICESAFKTLRGNLNVRYFYCFYGFIQLHKWGERQPSRVGRQKAHGCALMKRNTGADKTGCSSQMISLITSLQEFTQEKEIQNWKLSIWPL